MPSAAPPAILDSDVTHAFRPHKLRFQPLARAWRSTPPHFRVVAVIHKVDILFASEQSGRSASPAVIPHQKDNIGIALVSGHPARSARQSFAVLLFIVNDSDALRFHRFRQMYFRGRWPPGGVLVPAVRILYR